MTGQAIYPVILSGGSGSRLWPMSRAHYPKQFLPLAGDLSLFQETALRMSRARNAAAPLIITNNEHRFIVDEQLKQIGIEPLAIILEPTGRNTAPAAAVAALKVAEVDADGIVVLLPSDHLISGEDRFHNDLAPAVDAAVVGNMVTFGIAPGHPETGYGYIRKGDNFPTVENCFCVDAFVEKPDLETAIKYLKSGDYFWNSGMFVFSAASFLDELQKFQPGLSTQCQNALTAGQSDLGFLRLDEKDFAACPSISIDYAVMEKTDAAAVVMASFGWSDVGAWPSLWQASRQDEQGNAVSGDTMLRDVQNSYVRSEGKQLLTVIGVKDMVIVSTDDAVLVAPKERAAETKDLVDALSEARRSEVVHHPKVHRPWGSYEDIDQDERFRVKRIIVKPGAALSLQKHSQRSEHWVVVKGRARITRDSDVFELEENQSTYIPAGMIHRLENPGDDPLHLIEIQSGGYLGEDDIIRLEDNYGRTK
ncbi:MAG: mannose-1-phosphate guanylyltransferase/mannose-6-phosphate isomerase [Alphaproteobacteria bacterium]|jgi:mannose-1-phosphate guanylyltransferase / mannose-6-phosphate isomerase|nr:mannose-1-phosphate guanylyltransferase/mannose-6-phosphate isomerase [Alphaproteobacteria bacterium]MBT4086673.1 mannose-1-phosphate guanylyltransferase/mannose-6-phosphate isomerase [Alphaproteobacteria bacterium]MBT4546307.1 mannose-1-phosphate guanylyltransferase/mannose-6-phosphate isomerase [Alphaproteobacteria bacterium]MBT5919826.1 mannose-1-phosphate guanylyltransferase/mannose-6-phosphate isomerase [Alphaproteobacteria bacterium]MBT6386852.1 mannose-1-phosphate guanylyltransferase/